MQQIQLAAVPNQSLSFTVDGNLWQITIKQAVTSMIMDVVVNDQVLISGTRIPGDDFILPYPYIGVQFGNLMLTTERNMLPDYTQFGATQQLFYWTPEEMEALSG
jgi:hypothetical protein